MRRTSAFLLIVASLLTACDLRAASPGGATPFIITATLAPTAIPSATLTPMPSTATATVVPVQGITTTQVNVRGQPSTAAPQLGILPAFIKVQIVGRDTDGNWFEIIYPQGPNGAGWVTAQFINVQQGKASIPVVGGAGSHLTPAAGTAGASASGTVIQQVNVRKGPGTSFDAIGTLNPQDVVTLIGKDPSGMWLQIQFAGSPDGTGWVAATYVKATGDENLPIIGASGSVIETGTAIVAAPVLTATPAAALQDNDFAEAPAANVTFSPDGTRILIYSGDLSTPSGDNQDWVKFTNDSADVALSLRCPADSNVSLDLLQDGTTVPGWRPLGCGQMREVAVLTGKAYLIHLSLGSAATPAYVRYTLRVENVL